MVFSVSFQYFLLALTHDNFSFFVTMNSDFRSRLGHEKKTSFDTVKLAYGSRIVYVLCTIRDYRYLFFS